MGEGDPGRRTEGRKRDRRLSKEGGESPKTGISVSPGGRGCAVSQLERWQLAWGGIPNPVLNLPLGAFLFLPATKSQTPTAAKLPRD